MKLFTSYNEVVSFKACTSGLTLFLQVPGVSLDKPDSQIAITDCLQYCCFSDVVWLFGKRKVELEIAVKAAKKCAENVKHITAATSHAYAAAAAADAAYAAYAAAYAAYAYAAAAYADEAAAAADAAYAAYAAAADAADAADAARKQQIAKNKQFLLEEILAYEESH